MGMNLDEWSFGSCTANVGTGDGWATIYNIQSTEPGKGHATYLVIQMRDYYEENGIEFGSSVALSPAMKHLDLFTGYGGFSFPG